MQLLNSWKRHAPLLAFLAVWIGYFGLIAVVPYSSAFPNFNTALAYQVLFIACVAGPMLLLGHGPGPTGPFLPDMRLVNRAIAIGIVLSVLATVSLFIDKIFYMHIDYSQGVCQARYQMNRLGQEREGVSSAFSVAGNLLGYAYFVSLALVFAFPVRRWLSYATVILSFLCLMGMATIAASRSTMMLLAAFSLGLICLRLVLRLRFERIRPWDIALIGVMMALAAIFILQIFGCRAAASGLTSGQYLESFAGFLGARSARPGVAAAELNELFANRNFMELAILYAVHSAYTFAGILGSPAGEGYVLFSQYPGLLAKAGIHGTWSVEWPFAGRFSSVPGALYHDAGLFGLVAGGLLLGTAAALSRVLVERFRASIVAIGIFGLVHAILFLSPIHFAADFMAFPFIGFSFLLVPVLARLTAPRRKSVDESLSGAS